MKNFTLLLTFLFIQCSMLCAQTLQNIESVEYDPSQNRFLVSNSNSIIARTSDASLDYFGSGAASHGMEVMGNTLFVIDGSTVRGFDLTTEEEVMSMAIPGASFLNGMTNDGSENIYVTDFSADKIIKINVSDLSNPSAEIIVEDTGSTPNGIVYDGNNNRLIFVSWGASATIKSVNLLDNTLSTLTTTPYSNIDGIDEDNDGNYYISYWSSGTKISKYDPAFANPPETITVSGLSNPADICYAKEIDTLAIPHSGNQLTFLDFTPPIIDAQVEILDEKLQLFVFPNPIQASSQISFYLEKTTEIRVSVYDEQGRLLQVLMNGKQVEGTHHVMLLGLDIPKGISFAHVQVDGKVKVVKLFKD